MSTKRKQRKRWTSDCDSLFSFGSSIEMELGRIPFFGYTKNNVDSIVYKSCFEGDTGNWPNDVYGGDYEITKICELFKI